MPGRLSGKVCIVTGTGGSMGRATSLTFAREGALVVGCDVAVEPAEETLELVKAAGGADKVAAYCQSTTTAGDGHGQAPDQRSSGSSSSNGHGGGQGGPPTTG